MTTPLLIMFGPFIVLFAILAYFDHKNRTSDDQD